MIDYGALFEFGEDFSCHHAFRAGPKDGAIDDPWALCRGDFRPRTAIEFFHSEGRDVYDVIWTGFVAVVLVSRRFRDVLERAEFTGWTPYPVKVFDEVGEEIRGYCGLAFTGRSGPVDYSRSQKVWRKPRYKGGPKYQEYVGLFFKEDRWDGTDLFLPENTAHKIITEKVKNALSKLDIPNVGFERLTEFTDSV